VYKQTSEERMVNMIRELNYGQAYQGIKFITLTWARTTFGGIHGAVNMLTIIIVRSAQR
jgi:hypothetical protein